MHAAVLLYHRFGSRFGPAFEPGIWVKVLNLTGLTTCSLAVCCFSAEPGPKRDFIYGFSRGILIALVTPRGGTLSP